MVSYGVARRWINEGFAAVPTSLENEPVKEAKTVDTPKLELVPTLLERAPP